MESGTDTRPSRLPLDVIITKSPLYHQCLETTTRILTKGVVRHHHVLVAGALVLVRLLHAETQDGGLQGEMIGVMEIGETMTTDIRVMKRDTTVYGENVSMNDLTDVEV